METRGLGRQLLHPTQQANARALAPQLVGLVADHLLEQHEEPAHFVVGAGPVLAAEGVERENLDAPPNGVADDLADRLNAGRVAFHLVETACLGPSAGCRP